MDALTVALGPDFEVDRDMLREALVHSRTANVFFLPVLTKIDFFGLGLSEFDESEFQRRRAVAVDESGAVLVVKTPEDSVLRKLLWHRDGGRGRSALAPITLIPPSRTAAPAEGRKPPPVLPPSL